MDWEVPIDKVAFLGGFFPRRAGGTEGTTHLFNAFSAEFGGCECLGLAVSDVQRSYLYPSKVRFELAQAEMSSYRSAADFINLNRVDVLCLQYHPELFDGPAGEYLLELARSVKAVLVTAFQRIPQPANGPAGEVEERAWLDLARRSTRVIVFSQAEADQVIARAHLPAEKIVMVDAAPEAGAPASGGGWLPGEHPAWRALARQYMQAFRQARLWSAEQARLRAVELGTRQAGLIPVSGQAAALEDPLLETPAGDLAYVLPVLKLNHFLRMTDETGMLKASVLSLPDYRQGYTTTDNARALMFSLLLEQAGEGPFIPIEMQASRQLAFLWNAFNPQTGRFREAMSYNRVWQGEQGSEEAHGLVLWALGMTLCRSQHAGMRGVALKLFEAALPLVKTLSSLRAWGYSLLGIDEYLRRYPGDRAVARTGKLLVDRLVRQYQETAAPDWPWFEESLAGGSACVPHALIASWHWAGDLHGAEVGLKSLGWLASLQFMPPDGLFVPLGDPAYYSRSEQRRDGQRAKSAQRPIEARAMISACLEAYHFTGDHRWMDDAHSAFQWYLGRNELGQPLYDAETGGCCDGLLPGKLDENYSAESLLAFLVSQLEMRLSDPRSHERDGANLNLPLLRIGKEP